MFLGLYWVFFYRVLMYFCIDSVAKCSKTVLNMGVDVSRVKQALRYQIRATGQPFTSVDSLLEAAIEAQHHAEARHAMDDRQ